MSPHTCHPCLRSEHALWRHIQEQRAVAAGASPPKVARIPRMPLNELILMVISLALFPALANGFSEMLYTMFTPNVDVVKNWETIKQIISLTAFAVAGLLFPVCFSSAYHRLDCNDVPNSRLRMAFLFLYPYMVFSLPIAIAGAFMVLFCLVTAYDISRNEERFEFCLLMGGIWLTSLALLVSARVMAGKLKSSAELHAQQETPLPDPVSPL